MRVGLVSTYPDSRCAIGVYSQQLARALRSDAEVVIAAEHGATAGNADGISVRPCYARDTDYVSAVVDVVRAERCDVMHVQYAPDLFGEDARLPSLLRAARRVGIRTLVTMHTVYATSAWRRRIDRFHRALGAASDTIIVHHAGMARMLERNGVEPNTLRVVPHGTTRLPLPDPAESRRVLGLPARGTVLTFFGFIHVQKNVHTLIEAFIRARADATLLIAGMPWGDRWYNHLYVAALKARAARHGNVMFRGYTPRARVPHVYAASDVVVLPHHQRYGSASGVFHQAIGANRAVLCARGPKFEDANRLFASLPELTAPATNVDAWAQSIERIVSDPTLRDRCRELVVDYAQRTSWDAVATQHLDAYAS